MNAKIDRTSLSCTEKNHHCSHFHGRYKDLNPACPVLDLFLSSISLRITSGAARFLVILLVLNGIRHEASGQTLTTRYSFTGGSDGGNPESALILGSDGYLYGTAVAGGTSNSLGTVFRLSPSSSDSFTAMHDFSGGDGANPYATLVEDSDGNFYGTTVGGGTNGFGTVFRISPESPYSLTTLHSFAGGIDGRYPNAGLALGSDGELYGTAYAGGAHGDGVVFRISTNAPYTLTTLYSFSGSPADGALPYAGVVQCSDGNLYGTTFQGGTNNAGTLFRLSGLGTNLPVLTLLYQFSGAADGAKPYSGVVEGSDGSFYGTTSAGGTNNAGTVFRLSAPGNSLPVLTTLHSFTDLADGGSPQAGLVQGSDGNFYGTTYIGGGYGQGTLFRLSPIAPYPLTTLHVFSGIVPDGAYPFAAPILLGVGDFYGTTEFGGANGYGSIFEFSLPTLAITNAGSNVVLSWPAATSYSLQSATNLAGPETVWNDVQQAARWLISEAGATNFVTRPISASPQFFRLAQDPPPAANINGVPTDDLGTEVANNQSNGHNGDDSASSGVGQVSGPDLAGGGNNQDTGGGMVFLHNGELIQRATDLAIPSRGFNWKLDRTYRSGLQFEGPLGHNWEFNYNRRLAVQTNGDIIRMDGYGRADRYVLTTNGFTAPAGFFTQLTQSNHAYLERDRHGGKAYYSITNSQGISRLTSLSDKNGNQMRFQYNYVGQLITVLDTLSRAITYTYDPVTSLLVQVQDFEGRIIRYQYDSQGDLIGVTSPAVTGTPNGNDFPSGKTCQYIYSSGYGDPRLNHQLLSITEPNEVTASGPPSMVAQYQTNTSSPDIARVTQLSIGGTNGSGVPAGGTISYHYLSLGQAGSNDFNTAVFQNMVTDRNGNVAQYQFNQIGNIVQLRRYPRGLRNQEPPYYQTQFQFNQDGLMLTRTNPLGNRTIYTYDSSNPDRFQQGNLLSTAKYPDAARGGEQMAITWTWTYEPVYNQPLTSTSARGNDPTYVPQNGGPNSPARYTTIYTYDYQEGTDFTDLGAELVISPSAVQTRLAAVPMGLGDVNGAGITNQIHGNRIRETRPSATLLPGSNEAAIGGGTNQPIVLLSTFNLDGQPLSQTDPEGNLTQYTYYPQNNPNGDGIHFTPGVGSGPYGYLQKVAKDTMSNPIRDSGANPTPASVVNVYAYDLVGNLTRKIDGRGIATDYSVNQLNHVVQITRASAHGLLTNNVPEPLALTDFKYLTRIYYDANGNVVHRQAEDRGNTSGTGGFVDTFFSYDILNHATQMSQEVNTNTSLVTTYRYDADGNRTLDVLPQGNATAKIYDERNLLFQAIVGATAATPGTLGAPVITSSRTGAPSTYTRNYDQNGNLIERVDAADKDGSAANNSTIAGAGDVTRFGFDGFDRRNATTNAVGTQWLKQLDPDHHVVQTEVLGAVGGPSPVSSAVSNNVPLSIVAFRYDEPGRRYERDRSLFIPSGVTTMRPVSVTGGPLNGTSSVSARYEFDRNSRRAFIIDDEENTTRRTFDGVNRLVMAVDAAGNTTEWAYDGNNNVIEKSSTDISQTDGVSNEVFLTTSFYDGLNRLQQSVDNIGQSTYYAYDSRNNLVSIADANGPPSGSIARRAFPGGALTVNNINGYGNLTLYSYDGRNRRVRCDKVLTASGQGDGVHNGANVLGNRTATPVADTNQAGGDGLITTIYQWDGNSLLTSITDDNGNQTKRTYDNHNRMLTETKGVCVPPFLAKICATPTTVYKSYDADGDLIQFIDENGSVISNSFDAVDRVISRSIVPAADVEGTTSEYYQYDGRSYLVSGTDTNNPSDPTDDATVSYARDSLGRRVEEVEQIGATNALAIDSAWAGLDRVAVTYPNGRQIANKFDPLHRLASVSDAQSNSPIATYTYLGRRRLGTRAYPQNGTALTFYDNSGKNDIGYDGLRRPVYMRHINATNGATLVGFALNYNRANNPLSEAKLHALNDSELYAYDSGSRLMALSRGTLNSNRTAIVAPSLSTTVQTNWTLDGVGNWKTVDNETHEYNSFNELIQRSNTVATAITSDSNGSETNTGTLLFHYDYRNRLRSVTGSNGVLLASYAYDTVNRRIRKVISNSGTSNGTTFYYLDGQREIEERNSTNVLVQQYVYGRHIDEPLVLDRNLSGGSYATGARNQRLFYHQNRQDSVSALTDTRGNVVEGYQYEAYGLPTVFDPGSNGIVTFNSNDVITFGGSSALGNPFIFTGRRYDSESGLYYYRNRHVSPDQGRFLSRDPIGYRGGSLCLYEYLGGTPTSGTDPSGQTEYATFDFDAGEFKEQDPAEAERVEQAGDVLEGIGEASEIIGWTDVLGGVSGALLGVTGPLGAFIVGLAEIADANNPASVSAYLDKVTSDIAAANTYPIPGDGTYTATETDFANGVIVYNVTCISGEEDGEQQTFVTFPEDSGSPVSSILLSTWPWDNIERLTINYNDGSAMAATIWPDGSCEVAGRGPDGTTAFLYYDASADETTVITYDQYNNKANMTVYDGQGTDGAVVIPTEEFVPDQPPSTEQDQAFTPSSPPEEPPSFDSDADELLNDCDADDPVDQSYDGGWGDQW